MSWHSDRVTRTVYATDNSIYQLTPERVGLPTTAAEIAKALRENFSSEAPKAVVARGGGTGTNGQSLTNGLAIDLKRNMNRVLSIDVEGRTAVVQPGLVTAALNERLAKYGLFWPPHTSTLNRATVGGMVSTDAAGKGSLIYGRAHRHVERIVMLLDDGTEWIAEPVTEVEALRRAGEGGRGGELWQAILELSAMPNTDLGLPELARGFSGYGIDRLRQGDLVDPIALICGAEGTLGILTEITISLSPLPERTELVVASYGSFGDALEDAVALRNTGPSAIESFDETTLARGRSSPAWPALGNAIGDHQGAVLVLEYADASADEVAAAIETMTATGRSMAQQIVVDPADQAAVWKVRADAVGLLAKVAVGGPELSARPTAFVEDCAVPVASMPAFIGGFRKVLDDAGLTYAMFGHADVGCVHVRPALDLTNPTQQELVGEITRQVIDLVADYGGLIWGEHGRGFRGAHVDHLLPPETLSIMRHVKTAFDPLDIFNPGKLYRPMGSTEPLIDVHEPPMRGQVDASVPVEIRHEFSDAFACNGNGLCHHYGANEVMCPSYKATGDPALSPRGRVDLLRSWLADDVRDEAFEDAIAENLGACLSCSACTGRCPVEVDIPELKSQFLEHYYRHRRRPLAHAVMSRFESLAMLASRLPRLAGLGLKPAERLLGLVDLPKPTTGPRRSHPRFDPAGAFDVVVLPDVFTSVIEHATVAQSVDVLESLGYRTAVSDFVDSGKLDHVKGARSRFAKKVERQAQMVRAVVAAGAIPVVIEPAIALLHGHEYPHVAPDYPSGHVRSLVEMIAERQDLIPNVGGGAEVVLLGHCTERSLNPKTAQRWVEVLGGAGYQVQAPTTGCCGMAGVFGHEIENQPMSKSLWQMSWAQHVNAAQQSTVVATGYSCRSQAKRYGRADLKHPVHLLS